MIDIIHILRQKIESIRLLFLEDEVFYIGGSDVLPPPLERDMESQCLTALVEREIPEQDFTREDAKRILIEHNLRLVVYLAKKFENTGICVEDLISIGTIGLIKGINTFNPQKKIKLATYASRCIENEILTYLRRNNKVKLEVSFDEPLNVDWDGNELLLSDILGTDEDIIYRDMENEAEIKLLRDALESLSAREKQIICLRYGIGTKDGIEMQFAHELIVPEVGFPFKLFLFEGGEGHYHREKHWHRSIEIFAVCDGELEFKIDEKTWHLTEGEFMIVNSNEVHEVDSPLPNETIVLQIPLKIFEKYYTGEQFIWFTHEPGRKDARFMELLEELYKTYCEKQCGYDMKMKKKTKKKQ